MCILNKIAMLLFIAAILSALSIAAYYLQESPHNLFASSSFLGIVLFIFLSLYWFTIIREERIHTAIARNQFPRSKILFGSHISFMAIGVLLASFLAAPGSVDPVLFGSTFALEFLLAAFIVIYWLTMVRESRFYSKPGANPSSQSLVMTVAFSLFIAQAVLPVFFGPIGNGESTLDNGYLIGVFIILYWMFKCSMNTPELSIGSFLKPRQSRNPAYWRVTQKH